MTSRVPIPPLQIPRVKVPRLQFSTRLPTVPPEIVRATVGEGRKITTMRYGWPAPAVLAVVAMVVSAISAFSGSGPQRGANLAIGTAGLGAYVAVALAAMTAAVLAARGAGDEYRYDTLPLTVLFTPDRDLLLGAKLAVAAAYSLLLAVAAELGALVGLLAFGRGRVPFGHLLVELGAGGLLTVMCWGLLGCCLGLLLRSTAGAILTILVWSVLVEPLLWVVARGVGHAGLVRLLLGSSSIATVRAESFSGSSFLAAAPAAAVVLVLWTSAVAAAAWRAVRNNDP